LRKVWNSVSERAKLAQAGDCIYEELSLPLRILRDMMHSTIGRVLVDSKDAYREMIEFAECFIPDWISKIEYYGSEKPLFDLFNIEGEISQVLESKAELSSGAYLVFDQTEALTTIDVNTGAYVGFRDQQDTILKTNLDAAEAIARQLRLRNLGGIIIIDFIDMAEQAHKEQLLHTLEQALERDHARTKVYGLTALGLVEMTRQRTTQSLGQLLCETCPVCNGTGNIPTIETVSMAVLREITRSGLHTEASNLLVMATPRVIDYIVDTQSDTIAELEETTGLPIRFQREEQYTQEQFDVVLL